MLIDLVQRFTTNLFINMPTYEYKREDGTTFEIMQSMSDDPLKVCPTTGQPVKRMISGGSGLLFKGSGFYVTDYKNGKGKNGANGKTTDKSESGTTDSKETKTPSSDTKDSASGSKKETD